MDSITLERKALTVFEAMLEIDESKREQWLAEEAGDDPQLLARVTAIWRADTASSMQTGAAVEAAAQIPPPERVGAYRVTGTIGSGGMGSVYAAERDEGDFEHSVAIKLIKPGILSQSLVDRFNRERQILARFSHPNITRLLDGGETEDGQPYIVMERIEGLPLLSWIGANTPDEKTLLAMFLDVCNAVGYAHRNLIVHRDLTPANVLVDTDGQAKLIDFGIARPDGEEVGKGSGMPVRAVTMTPGYAAPERMLGDAATVSSDIYSAGKMLAEILPRPRPPEIDAIIAKATADEPSDRYLSMDQLADEVRLYLAGRPVDALPGPATYRFRKWVARNRNLAGLGAALAVALVVGAGATGWFWREAVVARDQADARFAEVRGIANFMLFDLYDELEPISGNTKALSQIADEARAYLERLSAADDLSPELQLEIARGYHRLSTVSGNPEGANLGRREDARTFLDRAISDLEGLHASDPGNADYTLALAEALYSEAILKFIGEDDNEGSIGPANRSAELYRALMQAQPDNVGHRLAWYRSRLQAAKPYVWIDKGAEGVERMVGLVAEIEKDPALAQGNPDARVMLASANSELGYTRSWHIPIASPEYATALPPLDRAVAIYDDMYRNGPEAQRDDRRLNMIASLFKRSLVHSDMEQPAKALADLERAEEMAKFIIQRDPDDEGATSRLDTLHSQKIYVLLALDRKQEAAALARQSLARRIEISDREPDNNGYFRDIVTARQTLAETLDEAGDSAACGAYREALAGWEALAKRAEVSSVDQQNSIEPLQKALARCSGR